jgi:hypothetical protein
LWQRLFAHVLRQGRLQLVLEVGFAGRRKERHGYSSIGLVVRQKAPARRLVFYRRLGQSLVLITSSTR